MKEEEPKIGVDVLTGVREGAWTFEGRRTYVDPKVRPYCYTLAGYRRRFSIDHFPMDRLSIVLSDDREFRKLRQRYRDHRWHHPTIGVLEYDRRELEDACPIPRQIVSQRLALLRICLTVDRRATGLQSAHEIAAEWLDRMAAHKEPQFAVRQFRDEG